MNRKMTPSNPRARLLILFSALCLAIPFQAHGEDSIAIASKTSNDYVRTRQPDGSFAAEYYTFGKGGVLAGQTRDPSIEKLNFIDIARTLAVPLEKENYLPSKDPKTTKILIMVYVGRTGVSGNPSDSTGYANLNDAQSNLDAVNSAKGGDSGGSAGSVLINPDSADKSAANDEVTTAMGMVKMENNLRQKQDLQTVSLLGYDSWWAETQREEGTPFEGGRQDLIQEVEEGRYFVVLMAYDFQLMWKQKKPKLLWEARYSIKQRGNDFEKQLALMTEAAAKYFGRSSDGLIHGDLPEGHVEIGEIKSLGTEPVK
jgi:hypothetical protein